MSCISLLYNLGRLGQAGDEITFAADEEERAALAKEADVLAVSEFSVRIGLRKLSPARFTVDYEMSAAITQACVVTLEPLSVHLEKSFTRELYHTQSVRREIGEVVVSPGEDELPEEIESLHYDLAGPLVEEFILAIAPYPRAPGVEFRPLPGMDQPLESPFAVLKDLKAGGNWQKPD